MSGNGILPSGTEDTRPANGAHNGRMPRWYTRDATHASFAVAQVGSHSDIYVPLATAALAGAEPPGHFALLANATASATASTLALRDSVGNLLAKAWQTVNAAGGAAPAYATNWADKGGTYQTMRFRGVGDYSVHIVGVAAKGIAVTAGETIFTLPAGFRPPADVPITIVSLTAGVVVSPAFGIVTSGGAVQVYGGDRNFIGINAIFYTD